ncbi:DEAD/DEAH box helicase family protein [Leuconostoc pseudomesenteroides]|uniref:DEAD/DEAH box helicase family protein n=1 Tax=Leuconostoc pseudomesenteroides TaxID=33968 RepID=UPI002152D598|nr:DEAD/DEAH box helicase family protein [Leuconostoc pseudomesenteroides]
MENLYGRQLVCPKIDNSLGNTRTAFQGGVCQRCNQKLVSPLPNDAFYCRACLTLGRVSSLDNLISLPEPNQFNGKVVLSWTGTLASQQQKVSEDLLTTLALQREHLVWAVTGAGKTEMLFPLIYRALQQKLRVGIVAPRVDVCSYTKKMDYFYSVRKMKV